MLKTIHILCLIKKIIDKDPVFKVGYYIRISKYKKFLQKTKLQIGLKECL